MQNSTAYNGTMQQTKKGGFKLHTKEDYREFFTRGMSDDDGLNRVHPWMYLRVFAACFILYSLVTFVTGITGNLNSFPFMFFLGGLLFDLPLITLLYELNPKKDLSVIKLLIILLVGGACSIGLAELLYIPVPDDISGWGLAALAGTIEEVVKIIPVFVTILILKKRDPVTCLIIGAAVGTGFSAIENMGYIFRQTIQLYYQEELQLYFVEFYMGQGVFNAVLRGITVASGHTFWAAFEGWAFGKFRARFGFWGICLSCMTMHFLWDIAIPFSEVMSEDEPVLTLVLSLIMLFIMGALTAIAIVVLVVLIKRGRREVLGVQKYGPPKEKCKRCGNEIDLFSKFCTVCGAKIERAFPPVQIAIPLTPEEMRIISAKNAAQAAERERVRMYESSLQTANSRSLSLAVECIFSRLMYRGVRYNWVIAYLLAILGLYKIYLLIIFYSHPYAAIVVRAIGYGRETCAFSYRELALINIGKRKECRFRFYCIRANDF